MKILFSSISRNLKEIDLRVLVISDVVDRRLYSSKIKDVTGDVDLVISCGDLPAYYLDFIISNLGKPLLYVSGNHDHYNDFPVAYGLSLYKNMNYPFNDNGGFGGKNIDNIIENYKGILFTGLEGSALYNNGEHQYSDRQMSFKITRLTPGLLLNKIFKGRYIDVLVAHSPPFGIHDMDDQAHKGFKPFLSFIKSFHPKYLLHGHVHLYDSRENRVSEFMGTKIINCYDYQIIDII